MRNSFKSIGAIVAGFIVSAVLSFATDYVLQSASILPNGNLYVSTALIWTVVLYRCSYIVVGSYVTARLAPKYPMRHVLVGGAIGFVLSIGAAIATADMNIGPAWYGWTLAALALPSAWMGGTLYALRINHQNFKAVKSADERA